MATPRRTILILGGTRFVGFHIARSLLFDGHRVTVLSRGRSPLFPEGAERLIADRTHPRQLQRAVRGRSFDVVIDMIAFREEETRGAIDVFGGRVGHYIHISTASVYAVLRELPSPIREEHYHGAVKQPDRPSRGYAYGIGKRRCEDALWEAHAARGLPVTTLRLPIILGEGDPTLRAQSYFLRVLDGEPLVMPDGGQNPMSLVYQGDLVDFVTGNLLNERVIGQALNLAQDEIPTVRGFVESAARLMGRRPELVDIPTELLRRIGFRFTASPFTSKRPFILSSARAQRLGAFRPTPMQEWLERTVRYSTAQGPTQVPPEYEHRELELRLIDAWREAAERFVGTARELGPPASDRSATADDTA
ncbi:MAG: NAD-dependent epimerase/dehydratase family protein [Candidatus Eiseniibacteriota bacterium]|jgi:nucleoside-diphosphate-sugar epimerase